MGSCECTDSSSNARVQPRVVCESTSASRPTRPVPRRRRRGLVMRCFGAAQGSDLPGEQRGEAIRYAFPESASAAATISASQGITSNAAPASGV